MNKPKFFKGRPIIQPGEIYEIDNALFKVVTATSRIIGENEDRLEMTEPVYWLDNIETNERIYMPKSELETKLNKFNSELH